MKFNIVTNSLLQRQIMKIDIFKLNMGQSIMNRKTESVQIKDAFVSAYENTHNRLIHTYGNIGTITFYTDLRIPMDVLLIHADNKIFDIVYADGDLPMRQFLSEALELIENHLIQSEKELQESNIVNTTWVAGDDKNKGKVYNVDQRLSREEYLNQLKEMKKL